MPDEILPGAQPNLDAMQRRREAMASGDEEGVRAVFAPGFVDRDGGPDQPPGPDGPAAYWAGFERSFSDVQREVVHTVATPEHVITVTQLSGTHTGEYLGHAPTGRRFSVRSVQVMRFEGERAVERWGSTDLLGILQQLGLSIS